MANFFMYLHKLVEIFFFINMETNEQENHEWDYNSRKI